MAFILLTNEKGVSVECIVFPKIFEKYKNLLIVDTTVIIDGQIDAKMTNQQL